MAGQFHAKPVLVAARGSVPSIGRVIGAESAALVAYAHIAWPLRLFLLLRARIASRFHKWREDEQTWDALRHLDDRQLKEFGIHSRPPELTKREFP